MIISKYDIELCRLTHDDIELIRTMRNRDDIRLRMFDQAIVTPIQQEQWFNSIDNMQNYFFVIQSQGMKVGLINGKNANFARREVEGGIYIWENSLIGTAIPAKASICFMEATFNLIRMERIYARVRKDNPVARRYNLLLGYVPDPERGEEFMVLTREAYEEKIPRLRKMAAGAKSAPPLSIEDVEIPNAARQMHLYKSLPQDVFDVFRPRLPSMQS
jgi:RimJ/RimL family protein N-acetyltransferase